MESWWCPLCEAGSDDWATHATSQPHLEARAASPFPGLDVYPEPCDGSIGSATAGRLAELARGMTRRHSHASVRIREIFEPFGSVERR